MSKSDISSFEICGLLGRSLKAEGNPKMTKRVRVLPNWPPHGGGAIRGGRAGISPERLTIGVITRIRKNEAEFSVNSNRRLVRYTQRTKSEHDVRGFAQILKDNVGKTLFSIGEIEIPEAGSQPMNLVKL
jgi:hypothetical protein